MDEKEIKLTEKEREFCSLFVDGDKDFAGQAEACYAEVFGERKHTLVAARKLLAKEYIAIYIKEHVEQRDVETETIAVKLQITETLKSVMAETSKGEYVDKFGTPISPASLRAVSVNAAKALMEIYPIKHSQGQGNKKDGGGGNIIFNVVIPQKKEDDEKNTEE